MSRRFFELFAGAGGLSMGLETAGWECIGHAEIEPHARAVLRHHWPDVPLYGDVAELTLTPGCCDLLTGGSPCQDLSVAGKRAGMDEGSGTRSSLFFEQMRLWRESAAPYCLWENVLGAFSSNKGRDFAAVLRAFVGAAIPVPSDGWGGAGVAAGPTGVAAWRVLDAQFFGVPQRRRRVFVLGAGAGCVDPAAVLLEFAGLLGDPAARREQGQGVAADARAGAARGSDRAVAPLLEVGKRTGISTTDPRAGVGIGADGDPMYTLQAGAQYGVIAFDTKGSEVQNDENVSPTLRSMNNVDSHANGGGQLGVISFKPSHFTRGKDGAPSDVASPLSADADRGDQEQVVLAYQPHGMDSRVTPTPTPTPTLHARAGTGGGNVPLVMSSGQANAEIVSDGEPSLTGLHEAPIVVSPSLAAGAHPGSYNGMDGPAVAAAILEAQAINISDCKPQLSPVIGAYPSREKAGGIGSGAQMNAVLSTRPRRLLPIECERLMGWPDHHTAIGISEQGKEYKLSDSARYKLCGNGVAAPVAAWIGFRLAAEIGASCVQAGPESTIHPHHDRQEASNG